MESYFLKCKSCGFDNELKTEFLTFCNQCGKKLPDNFQDWSRQHPGRGFDDYRKEVCFSGSQLQFIQTKPPAKKFPAIAGVLTGVAFMAAVFWGIHYFTEGNFGLPILQKKNTSESVLTGKWERFQMGKLGLSLESPEKPSPAEVKIPEEYKSAIHEMDVFQIQSVGTLEIVASSIVYQEGIEANLAGAANGAVNEMAHQPEVSGFDVKDSPLQFGELNGVLLDGSFVVSGAPMRFLCVIYCRKSSLWQVLVSYRDGDKNGSDVAHRIIDSIEIDYDLKTI